MPAGSPVPEIVTFVPAGATSGVVFSAAMVSDGTPASTTGPNSFGAPGMTGAVTGIGAATALA